VYPVYVDRLADVCEMDGMSQEAGARFLIAINANEISNVKASSVQGKT
jgi:hypothetical protein